MPLSDKDFLDSTRGVEIPQLGPKHTQMISGTRTCGLMLYSLIRLCHATRILEIGVGGGTTTIPMLQAASENNGILHSVDPQLCEEAALTVQRCGLSEWWKFHHSMTSDEYFAINNDPIHLAFIDGDHWQPYVERDISNVLTRLEPGGWLVLHDWNLSTKENMQNSNNQHGNHSYDICKACATTLPKFLPLQITPIVPEVFRSHQTEGGFAIIQKPSQWGHDDVALLADIAAGGYKCKVGEE